VHSASGFFRQADRLADDVDEGAPYTRQLDK